MIEGTPFSTKIEESHVRAARSIVVSTAVLGAVVLASSSTLAAPPVDSELFAYGQAECTGGGFVDEEPLIFTRAGFASVDGDNDVLVGATVNVAMGISNPFTSPFSTTFNNTVQLRLGDSTQTVTPATFTVPASTTRYLPPGAAADFTVQPAAAGTVLDARVDSWVFSYGNQNANCSTVAGEGIVGLYVNTPPVLAADAVSTDLETTIDIDVLTNDDATWDSGAITSIRPTPDELATQDDLAEIPTASLATALAIVATPAHGTVTINPDGTIEYEPTDDFVGNDPFTYSVTDNDGSVSTADVVVERELPELAVLTLVPSATSVAQGSSLTFTATGESAGGYDLGDVTDEITLASDVATDVVDGDQITFPSASPHVITATHVPTGVTGSVTVEVVPAGTTTPTTPTTASPAAASTGGGLPSTGGPVLGLLLAGLIGITTGGVVLSGRRHTA